MRPAHFRPGTADEQIFMKVSSRNEYNINPNGKVIVDIGAHIGGFVTYCVQRRARYVYAFESNPESFVLLERNVGHYDNVKLFPNSVWWNTDDTLGSYTLNKHIEENTGAKGVRKLQEGDIESNTPMLFETFVKNEGLEKIDILKLDCEAAEYPILYTMPKDILQRINVITGEIHPQEYYGLHIDYEFGEYGFSVEELARYLEDNKFDVDYRSVVREETVRRSFLKAVRNGFIEKS